MRTVSSRVSVLSLAGLLAACNSSGNPSVLGGQGGKGSSEGGRDAADTTTSPGTGGIIGSGGTSAGAGGTSAGTGGTNGGSRM